MGYRFFSAARRKAKLQITSIKLQRKGCVWRLASTWGWQTLRRCRGWSTLRGMARIFAFGFLLSAFCSFPRAHAAEPPVIPIGLDAYRQWDRWPYQRIGART